MQLAGTGSTPAASTRKALRENSLNSVFPRPPAFVHGFAKDSFVQQGDSAIERPVPRVPGDRKGDSGARRDQNLSTTQAYIHLSSAALEVATLMGGLARGPSSCPTTLLGMRRDCEGDRR